MLKHKISLLEASNDELKKELQKRRISDEDLKKKHIFDAQKLASKRQSREMTKSSKTQMFNNSEGHAYDLQPKGNQQYIILEDTDTSDESEWEYTKLRRGIH